VPKGLSSVSSPIVHPAQDDPVWLSGKEPTMMLFPPMPGWDGLHPLVVHFPIALLLVAPIFLIIGIARREQGRPWLLAAFLLTVLGTVAAWVAVSTGEAAGELAERTPEINAAIERHQPLGELVRTLFTVITLLFAAILFGPGLLRRKLAPRVNLAALILFLGIFGVGALAVVHTGHEGGRLVHEFGVKSIVAPTKGRSIFLGRGGGRADEEATPGESGGPE
jgi:uncharacterized membrane protein